MPNIGGLIDAQATEYKGCFSTEPTLADLFGDPMTRVLMAADHVDDGELYALLQKARHFVTLAARC